MSPKTYNLTPVTLWLCACCALVFLMVIVGAITRLTESGLSIVEWKPLIGAIPPLSEKEWNRVFDLYKQSPEYMKKNFWMELSDFKYIFFWEWFHRFLGRFIGLAYALPLLWFWVTKKIPQGYGLKLLGILLLGGLQGGVGWYMVKSGLVNNPAVSHYRLALHLLLAFVIFAAMLWLALSLRETERSKSDRLLFYHAKIVLLFVTTTVLWGAFTAGLDAGLIYNDSFPKMGGRWIPREITDSASHWRAITETHGGVQFAHRWLAITTVVMILLLWLHAVLRKKTFAVLNILAAFALLQAGLGILTLFTYVWIPAAVMHQAGALTLFALTIGSIHTLRPLGPIRTAAKNP